MGNTALVERLDHVAGADDAVAQDIGAQATAVHERSQDSRPREPLQVGARLAAALPQALGGPDAKAPPA